MSENKINFPELFFSTYRQAVVVSFVFHIDSMLLVLYHVVILVLFYLLLVDLDLHHDLILILLFVSFEAVQEHLLRLFHPLCEILSFSISLFNI